MLANPTFHAGGDLFITWDESSGAGEETVPMIIVSPKIKRPGYTSTHPYNHASYLATVEDIFGLPRLGKAQAADTLLEFLTP